MNIPKSFIISTPDFMRLQGKLLMFCASIGCARMDSYFDLIQAREFKQNKKFVGKYLTSKICEEFEISEYQLFESGKQSSEVTIARHFHCILAFKLLGMSKAMASRTIGRSKHLAKRAFKETEPRILNPTNKFDVELAARYRRLESLINAYINFQIKPKKGKQPDDLGLE